MPALIVLAHPERRSYNGHLAALAAATLRAAGMAVEVSDLYAADFDPRESPQHYPRLKYPQRFDPQREQRHACEHGGLPDDVRREMARLRRADLLILKFPLWWFGLPAILKGWMDRVFVYGGLYSSTRRHDTGAFAGKRALLCVTSGSSEAVCAHNGREGDTRLMLWPTMYALRYVGYTVLEPFIFYGVRNGLADVELKLQQARMLQAESRYVAMLRTIETTAVVPFNAEDDWDTGGVLKPSAPSYSPFIRQRPELDL